VLDTVRHVGALARYVATARTQNRRNAAALRELEARPPALPQGLEIEWLGVAGYRLTYQGHTLVIDPYVSRAPLSSLLRRQPTVPDPAMLGRFLSLPGTVVGVLVGHTHFDHAVDTPAMAREHGCPALGSRSLQALMDLHGVRTLAVVVEPLDIHDLGPFRVTFVPSRHAKVVLGLRVPFAGELTCRSLDRLTPSAYRVGQVWSFLIEVAGIRLYHQGSADLIDDAVPRGGVDVFLAGIAGREFTPDYWTRVLTRLEPAVVVPCHYDDFFRPLGSPMGFLANVSLSSLADEVAAVTHDVELAGLPLLRPVGGDRPDGDAEPSGEPGALHA
jgi:L-ascorbate metabolism protein UlaG (beta-lactamase superfamily)